ncbi:MAG: hypothetical protein H0W88_01775 [Parachlamydiaceae bacterium]|nr:hypothetical protein [Parachlamydiaceae bacterium]
MRFVLEAPSETNLTLSSKYYKEDSLLDLSQQQNQINNLILSPEMEKPLTNASLFQHFYQQSSE